MIGRAQAPAVPLVLKKFEINEHPLQGGLYFDIVGRSAGFVAWVLNLGGFDPTNHLQLREHELRFRKAGLDGEIVTTVPLDSISSASCGFEKPALLLVLAVLAAVTLFGIPLAVILFFMYKTNKFLRVSVETSGGMIYELRFKRSLIEQVNVDLSQAMKVIDVLNKQILVGHSMVPRQLLDGKSIAPPSLPATSVPAIPPPPPLG